MLSKLSLAVRKMTSVKSFLVLLVIYVIVYSVFFYADIPFGLSKMKQYAGTVNILDVKLFYSASQAYATLDELGEEGRAIYLHILAADMIYPLTLGLFLAVAPTLTLQNILPSTSRLYFLNVLPLANTLFDYCENATTFTLLKNYPAHLNIVASIDGFLTLAKNLSGSLSAIILFISLVIWIYQKLANRIAKNTK